MKVFNTLSDGKKELEIPSRRALRLFVCGPTVYDYPHIGNARTFMVFDIFARYLRSKGVKLAYLQNITDIDDKIIDRANEQNTDWEEIARRYEKIFLENMKALGIKSVDMYARATNYIPEIIVQIKTLIQKKHAYLIEDDGYYFDLSTFPNYGKLSRRTVSQAEDAVSRIDRSEKKRNRGDFALWKLSKENEPGWKTELGFGRPGWHIEDTAITERFFGPQYDIHGGALDLKFPHHEAEIAQQESASGKTPFVRTWMHSGFLTARGEKMSKSLQNFVTVNDFLAKYPAEHFRMLTFMHHYRSPLDYTEELVSTAKKNLSDIGAFIAKLKNAKGLENSGLAAEFTKKFTEAMEDDLNTPKALAAVFEIMAIAQPVLWSLSPKSAKALAKSIEKALLSAGLAPLRPKITLKAKFLARRREKYRTSQQFMQSDALRNRILELGFTIEDTPNGPFLWPKT